MGNDHKRPPPPPTTIVADDPEDRLGRLKSIGESKSDAWNNILANQAAQALWVSNSSREQRDKQFVATVAALAGIAPVDELEGMIAAQLIAAHNAAMECHRRAMLSEQTFEGRRENLNQANKLSRTYAALVEALDRHRGKGHQKVTVEHVHVHAGGQAVVGTVSTPGMPRGGVSHENSSQSHAPSEAGQLSPPLLGYEQEIPMPMPGASVEGEEGVSHARRASRGAER